MKFIKKLKIFLRNMQFLFFSTPDQIKLKNLTNHNFHKSVIIFTHHKCASTFINKLILKIKKKEKFIKAVNWSNLISAYGHYINFTQHYKSLTPKWSTKKIDSYESFFEKNSHEMFNQFNHIYGPIRNCFSLGFSNKFKKIIFVRNPLDTLVSAYYSFGHSHKTSNDKVQGDKSTKEKKYFQKIKIDKFALDLSKEWLKPLLNSYMKICQTNPDDTIVITYEDLIKNPKKEIRKMLQFASIDSTNKNLDYLLKDEVFTQINVKINSHQRNGRIKQYTRELSKKTINKINIILNKENKFFWSNLEF